MQPMLFIKLIFKPLFISLALISLIVYMLSFVHLVDNQTSSEPMGYYLLYKGFNVKPEELKAVCLDKNSRYFKNLVSYGLLKTDKTICNNHYVPILKKVIATPGDVVTINSEGVYVNQILADKSKPLTDRNIDYFKITNYKLMPNEYLVLGNNIRSYDSRYFGIVNSAEIKYSAIYLEGE